MYKMASTDCASAVTVGKDIRESIYEMAIYEMAIYEMASTNYASAVRKYM
jgi:hypothetical protein